MQLKKHLLWTALGLGALFGIVNCGGGGGGSTSNRPPVAPNPTCNGDIVVQKSTPRPGGSNVFVPPVSIEQPGDAGVRVHTHYLISTLNSGPNSRIINGLHPDQVAGAYGAGTS